MKNILFVFGDLSKEEKAAFESTGVDCEFRYRKADEVTAEDVAWAELVIGNIPPKLLHEPENIRFVQLTSAGADSYVADGLLKKGTVLTNCTGAYSQTVAEHAFAATLMLQKDLQLYRDKQSARQWQPLGTVSSISDSVVLIVGLGDIGCTYARMAKALGAYVIGVKRRATEKPDFVDELYTTDDYDKVAPRADVIFSVLPGTPATTHFFTIERFRAMKDSAIFINCGRGSAVSLEVLEQALRENAVRAMAVDVFETEPLPADSPLWGFENLLITPHSSGFFHLPATRVRVLDICRRNLEAWLKGEPLVNIVDFATGYKA